MIHREGYATIAITVSFIAALNFAADFFGANEAVRWLVFVFSFVLFILILQFFRTPSRKIIANENHILSPADGKVVAIEEVTEEEYFHDRRIQISVFMSPLNVHVNRYPASGKISFYKYHPGKYLVAWHPKSSTENERTTVVVKNERQEILFRQIAGALARRIVFYGRENESVKQGNECGFIKFGSRVDIFLPLTAKVTVKLNETVTGGVSVIGNF